MQQPDRVERQHRRELPALSAFGRREEQPDRPLHLLHGGQLLAGERQPRGRGDPPAAQIAGLEARRGGRAASARGRRPARRGRRAGRRARGAGRRGRRRWPGRRARSAAGRGRAAALRRARAAGTSSRVQSRPASRSARAWPSIRARTALHRQPGAVEAGDAVAAQHDPRVRVGAAPAVGVVGVHRLVGREPRQRPPAEALEHSCRARAAALQLRGGVGETGLLDQPGPLELLGRGRPAALEGQRPCGNGRGRCGVDRSRWGGVNH